MAMLTFRASKMLSRLEREGRLNEVDDKHREMMNLLDGEPANTYNWRSQVYGEPLALIAGNDRHPEMYVNVADCD